MNTKLLLSGAALGLLASLSACQKKTAAPPPAASESAGTTAPAASGAPAASESATASSEAPPAESGSGGHAFGLQSGRVEYQVSGAETGTEVLTWDNWGARMAIQTKAMFGTMTEDKTTLVTMDRVTTVDNTTKSGTSMANTNRDFMMGSGTPDEIAAKMMTKMGATKQGTETVLDKTCDKYVSANGTTCVWQGIALKTETGMNGAVTTKVATKIEENATPDPTAFDVPAGTTVQDLNAMAGPTATPPAETPAPVVPEPTVPKPPVPPGGH